MDMVMDMGMVMVMDIILKTGRQRKSPY